MFTVYPINTRALRQLRPIKHRKMFWNVWGCRWAFGLFGERLNIAKCFGMFGAQDSVKKLRQPIMAAPGLGFDRRFFCAQSGLVRVLISNPAVGSVWDFQTL